MKELILNTDAMVTLFVTILLAAFAFIAQLHGELKEIKHSHREALKEAKGEAGSQIAALEARLRNAESAVSALQELYKRTEAGKMDAFHELLRQHDKRHQP